jgi:hypothetical protein
VPLKLEDLKTVEAYKKAIRNDAGKIDPKATTKFWVYRDVELPNASGKPQKLPVLIVLVDNHAVLPVLKGKKLVCSGHAGLKEGEVAFEADQGTVPYKDLKASTPQLLGKPTHIPSGADLGGDAAQASPAHPPAPEAAGPNPSAQLNNAWKELEMRAHKAIAASPAKGKMLTAAMAGIPELLSSGKLADAKKRLEMLDAAIQAPPPAPPAPPTAPAGPAGAQGAQLTAAWNHLLKQAQEQAAANPARRGVLAPVMAGVPEMLRAGKFDEAQKHIANLEHLLKEGQKEAPYPGIVKYRASLVQFAQARSVVKQQIAALRGKIKSELPHEAQFADDLAAELEELNQEFATAVDEAIHASENQASPVTDAVRLKIRKYLTELSSNSLVADADTNTMGVTVTIAKTLGEALQRIQASMPA